MDRSRYMRNVAACPGGDICKNEQKWVVMFPGRGKIPFGFSFPCSEHLAELLTADGPMIVTPIAKFFEWELRWSEIEKHLPRFP